MNYAMPLPNSYTYGYSNMQSMLPYPPPPPDMRFNNNNNMQMQTSPSLNGKIVDGEDVVRATEVPIGGYGIFPKADLKEIYVKSWNNNGTTSVITYKPIVPEIQAQQEPQDNGLTQLLMNMESKINKIEEYLASVSAQKTVKPVNNNQQEVLKNGF